MEQKTRKQETHDKRKSVIFEFVKLNSNLSQGKIAEALLSELEYTTKNASKNSIGRYLNQLKNEGKIDFKINNNLRGAIPSKIWFAI